MVCSGCDGPGVDVGNHDRRAEHRELVVAAPHIDVAVVRAARAVEGDALDRVDAAGKAFDAEGRADLVVFGIPLLKRLPFDFFVEADIPGQVHMVVGGIDRAGGVAGSAVFEWPAVHTAFALGRAVVDRNTDFGLAREFRFRILQPVGNGGPVRVEVVGVEDDEVEGGVEEFDRALEVGVDLAEERHVGRNPVGGGAVDVGVISTAIGGVLDDHLTDGRDSDASTGRERRVRLREGLRLIDRSEEFPARREDVDFTGAAFLVVVDVDVSGLRAVGLVDDDHPGFVLLIVRDADAEAVRRHSIAVGGDGGAFEAAATVEDVGAEAGEVDRVAVSVELADHQLFFEPDQDVAFGVHTGRLGAVAVGEFDFAQERMGGLGTGDRGQDEEESDD